MFNKTANYIKLNKINQISPEYFIHSVYPLIIMKCPDSALSPNRPTGETTYKRRMGLGSRRRHAGRGAQNLIG